MAYAGRAVASLTHPGGLGVYVGRRGRAFSQSAQCPPRLFAEPNCLSSRYRNTHRVTVVSPRGNRARSPDSCPRPPHLFVPRAPAPPHRPRQCFKEIDCPARRDQLRRALGLGARAQLTGGARRFVARTPARDSASVLPTDRRRLCAPRPPGSPIAPGSTRARDEAHESAYRSPLERSPRSAALVGPPAAPVGQSRNGGTDEQPPMSRGPGAVERWSGCHRSPVAACASRIPNSLAESRLEATLRGA